MRLKKIFTSKKESQKTLCVPNKNLGTLETECFKTRAIINDLANELDQLRKSQHSHSKSTIEE